MRQPASRFTRHCFYASLFAMASASQLFAGVVNNGGANAYLDTFGALDIGEEVVLAPVNGSNQAILPALGPTAALVGPVSTGLVSGQHDIECGIGDGTNPADCNTAGYFTSQGFNFGWGVLDVTAGDKTLATFVPNGSGQTFFQSTVGANGGFGTVTPGAPAVFGASRFVQTQFNLEDSDTGFGGVVLQPGRSYVFFTVLSPIDMSLQTIVPGEDGLIGQVPTWEIYDTAITEAPPFQLHSDLTNGNFIDVLSGVVGTQLATSRVIPIIPEPGTMLLVLGGAALVARRRQA